MLQTAAPVVTNRQPVAPAVGEGLDWAALQPLLLATFGAEVTETWLTPLQPLGWLGGVLTLAAPTAFFAMQVQTKFVPTLEALLSEQTGQPVQVQLQVVPAALRAAPAAAPFAGTFQPLGAPSVAAAAAAPAAAGWQHSSKLDGRYTFATFVTGKSNTFAFTAAQSVAATLARGEAPGFNPFFLHGGVGLGKTHLMQAIGHAVLATRPNTQTMYLSAEQFLNKFIKAMQDKTQQKFKEIFRGVDVLMIDDIQFIAGKDNTQEEFFHTFNHLLGEGKQIILTADRPPHALVLEERLKSRLGSGLTVEVHAPEEETRLAILRTKAESMQVQIPAEVLNLLASHIASNVRELEGALNRLVAYNRLTGQPITEALAREQLRDLFKAYTRILTVEDIQQKVANHFNIRMADMHSPRRAREVARPRQVAMFLAKQLTQRSYPDIGRSFGGRDHTTVMHACQQIENLLPRDPQLAEHVQLLTKALTGRSL
ncbi:MAG: chromosomal replication initiator protein DnaA [Alphaproteobacteria bacterium]|nr:chromosomal replication initiator protein DnaA [Alphaproteobacteria bacterium]